MSKQTALKWFIEQVKEYDFSDIKDAENWLIKIPVWVLTEKEEQALQMEKEQIVEAYQAGDGDAYNLQDTKLWGQEFYNETYGGKDENNS